MSDEYKEKLIALCEGLEMNKIDELIEEPVETISMVGKHMGRIYKDMQSNGCAVGSFGWAIERLKEGSKVTRHGWNGRGMFLTLAGDYSVEPENLREGTHISAEFLASRGVDKMEILPHIDMWTADNKYVPGWLASQTDMLSEDWEEVE